jgi:hypothetical protein
MQKFTTFLPETAVRLIRTGTTAEFATVSAAGIPIDTPSFFFPNADLTTLDIGTGVSYPAKAERARRNPRTGMLIEGKPDQPVISIAGFAAVQDADIQANLERYLAETIFSPNVNPDIVPWSFTQTRLYYCSRIIVAVAPVHVRWWPCRAAMDGPPEEWRAPADTVFPQSDPAPLGKPSKASQWGLQPWRELADQAVAGGLPCHLTLLDSEGFPIPIRVPLAGRTGQGFRLTMPRGAPWSEGTGTLSFAGKEVFVGTIRRSGGETLFEIERALPILPTVRSRDGIAAEEQAALDQRLVEEVARRGQPMPIVPDIPPAPTEGARYRMEASLALDIKNVCAGISE